MKLVNAFFWIPFSLALVACGNPAQKDSNASSNTASADQAPCVNNVGGTWRFGAAPDGCDSNSYGSDSKVNAKYSSLIFDENKNSREEMERYVSNMGAFLNNISAIYIKQRKRNVSLEEIDAWKHAVLSMAHQESYWSHYRISKVDGRLKFMRGDYGHGYGLMQVDDRWHGEAISDGTAWDILPHALFSMDMFYKAWNLAGRASCVTNLEERARSAYSMYNGGFTRSCRWTNSNDKWARNDKGFIEKYRAQKWSNYADLNEAKSDVNITCLVNQEDCSS